MVDRSASSGAWRGFDILVVSPTPTHPQDHGNRKRIYEICAELKRQGARVHFVHYPAEHDWRHAWPIKHENDMRAAWDSYQLIAPSRPLHCEAYGDDHQIDEWADPDVQHFLAWACRVRAYDMAIVNYTWMSFCLDAIPPYILKVCDTHDVFSDRRLLLEANGIQREFFHTTKFEEAHGLSRSDLVWAIKASEQGYFEKELGLPKCLTMLHAEPEHGWWTRPPSTDGWLRAGVIGARNNVNRRNLEEFLKEALPIFERYMAPVKIVIAGGCSEDFTDWSHPGVEILGRVQDVADFYAGVDVVIAPMQFSTGLKIKVSEALSAGAPLLAHAHAMEGYPTSEPLHQLGGFAEMAFELVKLAFDPSPLPRLAAQSQKVCATIQASVRHAIEATRQQLRAKLGETICVVAPMEALDPASLLHDHLLSVLDYLRFLAPLAIYVVGGPCKGARFEFLERFELKRQIFADPDLVVSLGELAPEFWTPIELASLLENRGIRRGYFLTDCHEKLTATSALRLALVRHDAIEVAGGDADALIDALRRFAEVVVIGSAPSRILRWTSERGIADIVHAPFRRQGDFEFLYHRPKPAKAPKDLLVLACAADPIADELLALAEKLDFCGARIDPTDPALAAALIGRGGEADIDLVAGLTQIRIVIDMTEHNTLAAIICEIALRLGVPRLVFQRGAFALALHQFAPPLYPTSVARLFTTLAECAINPAALAALRAEAEMESHARFAADAGWTILWRLLSQPAQHRENSPDAAAQLWG